MGPRRKYIVSILIMTLLIGGIWAIIATGCSTVTQAATNATAASVSPSPSSPASTSPSASASPSASVTSSAVFVGAATPSPSASSSAKTTVSPSPSARPSATGSPAPATSGLKETCKSPMKARLGLDLQGGLSVVLTPKNKVKQDTLEKAIDIIRSRVDALGVAEPDISRQGQNILVQLPGVKDPSAAIKIIGTTAEMRFRPVIGEIAPGQPQYNQAGPPCDAEQAYADEDADPTKQVILCARAKNQTTNEDLPRTQWSKLELGPAALVGSDVSGALAEPPSGNQLSSLSWDVSLNLTGAGAKKFEKVTGDLACNQGAKRQLAIVLDHVVESHPQMADTVKCHEGIAGGKAQITGNFSEKEAQNLSLTLRYGALPVALEQSTTTLVSPTLGKDTLRTGLVAGFIGLALVMLYVLVFYRVLGLVVWIGLAYFGFFVLGVVIILGKTAGFSLSLAGIAGLIVSVGIATDSYIVYYERLKDEVHQGRTIRAAVDRAWDSARRTIVAADLVTGLAAITLYVLAVGSVRGFALTLGLATALDVFISYLLMHPGVWLLGQTKFFNRSGLIGVGKVVGSAEPAPVAGGQS